MKHMIVAIGCGLSLVLIGASGCGTSRDAVPLSESGDETVPPGVTSVEGYVEPLVPRGGATSGQTGEPEKVPPDGAGARRNRDASPERLLAATAFGKIAAEAVPMPPVADLVAQIDEYVAKIAGAMDDLDGTIRYQNDADGIVRDANGLALVALAVGMSEAGSKYKKAAPGIIAAARKLAEAEQYAEGRKGVEALKASLTGEGDPGTLSWGKVAELPPVMKAVPNLSATLNRLTNTERKLQRQLDSRPERIYGHLAALAAIMQGSIANAGDTAFPEKAAEWKNDCETFRDIAIKANAAAHRYADGSIDYGAYWATFKELTGSCDQCHQHFYPSAVGKSE